MKKFFTLFLIFTILCVFCSCNDSSNSTTEVVSTNSIQLTADNYETYIKVGKNCLAEGTYECYDDFGKRASLGLCDKIWAAVQLEGLSTNFNYNDIKIIYKVSGIYERYAKQPSELIGSLDLKRGQVHFTDYTMIEEHFEFEFEVKADITGKGKGEFRYEIPGGYRTNGEEIKEYKIEVVSISGTVTPA